MALQLPQVSRATALWWSALARACAIEAVPRDAIVAAAIGEPVQLHAPHLESWVPDATLWTAVELHGPRGPVAALAIRTDWLQRIAQRLLGGRTEVPAPRPATDAEHAVWAYVVGAMLHAANMAFDVAIPLQRLPSCVAARIAVTTSGGLSACMLVPLTAAPLAAITTAPTTPPRWWLAPLTLPVVLATTMLQIADWRALGVRDVIVVAPLPGGPALAMGTGWLPLRWSPGQPHATVVSRYGAPAMSAVPPESALLLTVTIGSATMTLARLATLAVGEIIELGTPTQGGVELRLAGEVVGRGELVDVDGEMGVRVVALGPKLPA